MFGCRNRASVQPLLLAATAPLGLYQSINCQAIARQGSPTALALGNDLDAQSLERVQGRECSANEVAEGVKVQLSAGEC